MNLVLAVVHNSFVNVSEEVRDEKKAITAAN
jgi:hypothetical protein